MRYAAVLTRPAFDLGLRDLTTDLWDTVARVERRSVPDDEDHRTIQTACFALQGQVELLNEIGSRVAGQGFAPSRTPRAVQGTDIFVELIAAAARQTGHRPDLNWQSSDGINYVISTLKAIEEGNQETASDYVALFERVARLAEQL